MGSPPLFVLQMPILFLIPPKPVARSSPARRTSRWPCRGRTTRDGLRLGESSPPTRCIPTLWDPSRSPWTILSPGHRLGLSGRRGIKTILSIWRLMNFATKMSSQAGRLRAPRSVSSSVRFASPSSGHVTVARAMSLFAREPNDYLSPLLSGICRASVRSGTPTATPALLQLPCLASRYQVLAVQRSRFERFEPRVSRSVA